MKMKIALAAMLAATVNTADAQSDYPNRVVKIVNPYVAGSTTDVLARALPRVAESSSYPFLSWFAFPVALPWWVLAIVLGREAAMTWFRYVAQRRGVVIAAIGPGKAKATFQYIWVGAAYFWFAYRTWIDEHGFTAPAWDQLALAVGTVGTISMVIAVVLTVWSFALYLQRFGKVLR